MHRRVWINFLSKFFILAVNHLLSRESWARDCLIPYSGKIALIKLPPISIIFIVQHNGYLSLINDDVNRVDTTIILSSNIVALFIKKCYPILIEQIKIYGDVEFATQISKLGRYLRWEPEEDIASLIGDECAYRMLTLARNIGLHAHRISRNIIDSFIEYWLDENPQVVRRETYKDIVIEFSELCTALARVERKIEHLEKIGACGK